MHSSTATIDLPTKAAQFVTAEFNRHNTDTLYYHNLKHTEEVVTATRTLAEGCQLSDEEKSIIITAAWFHDVGHVYPEKPAIEASVNIARDFLSQTNASQEFIEKVVACIEATEMPQKPNGLLEEILCDADMAHLAGDNYEFWSNALRKENKVRLNKKIKRKAWDAENIKFFKQHDYFTDFARKHFNSDKYKNLQSLKSKIASPKKKTGEKEKSKVPKGGELMYRVVMRMHMDLSAIADTKANIMISVNAILLSILVTVLFRRIEEYTSFWLPGVILTTVCLLTIVFAILATLPQVQATRGRFRKEEVVENRANMLFFGNFYSMKQDDFEWSMKVIRQNEELAYGNLTRDLYNLGKVLARKI